MYTCMYIYIYILHTYIHIRIYIYGNMYIHIHMYIYTYIYIYICIYVYICIFHMCIYMYVADELILFLCETMLQALRDTLCVSTKKASSLLPALNTTVALARNLGMRLIRTHASVMIPSIPSLPSSCVYSSAKFVSKREGSCREEGGAEGALGFSS